MKKVYLIRHGQPDFPTGQRMCLGRTDLPLSYLGHTQARDMAACLPPVTQVFSSPLTRAIQTASAIQTPTVVIDLQELDAGAWDGLTFDTIRTRYPQLYAARSLDKTLPLPEAEPNDVGLCRFLAAMAHCARTAPGDFAVVAHGGVIALFLQHISGTWYKPDYCEVVPLFWNHQGFFTKKEETHA